MTIAPSPSRRAGRLPRAGVAQLIDRLETDFGRTADRREGSTAAQFLLDLLDRGEHRTLTVWPVGDPIGVYYHGSGGLVVPAGLPEAAGPLAAAIRATGWRVLVGDLTIGGAVVDDAGSGLFRRRPYAREQHLMVRTAWSPAAVGGSPVRRATAGDTEVLTEFACGLHVEDRMGPPLSRSGRASVRQRVANSVRRGSSWVLERDGRVVAKVDVAIDSRRRGAQLAGVYVAADARGRGVARSVVGEVASHMLGRGLPAVTLHVRADNEPAIRAYRAAGFVPLRRWILALR